MPDHHSHKHRTLRGVLWNSLRVFGQTAISLATGIVLARLLQPEDFGLLALAMVFIGVADLIAAAGMEPAVIQRRDLTETHLRVATTLSLLSGTLLALLFWALAQPISAFFGEPRVAAIIPVLACGLALTAATATSRGLLIRRMEFRILLAIDLVAYLVGSTGVSIGMALLGYGVWSLVVGTVVTLVIQGVALAWIEPLRFPLSLSRREARDLLGFGGAVSLNEVINYFASNVDYLVIGRYLEATRLGLYARAYSLASMPVSKIASSLSGALFPSYAEVQHDREKLGRGYLKTIHATALLTFPLLAGFIVSGELIIVGLLGEKWRPAAAAFRILALAGAFKTIFHLAGAVAQATDNMRGEIARQSVYLALLVAGCWLLVGQGIEAVAWVVVFASFWLYLSMAQFVQRITGISWADFFRAQRPGVFLAGLVAVCELPLLWLGREAGCSALTTLFLVIAVSALVAVLGVLFLPQSLLGPMPAWVLRHLAHNFPPWLRLWIERRFAEE